MLVYIVCAADGMGKIGKTRNHQTLQRRINTLQSANGAALKLLGVVDRDIEKELQEKFNLVHRRGEWFKLEPEIRAYIAEHTQPCEVTTTAPVKKRRGRPPSYVLDKHGYPIVGLSFHKPSGRFYTTHHRPPVYFGRDRDQALELFYQWRVESAVTSVERTGIATVPLPRVHPGFTSEQLVELAADGCSIATNSIGPHVKKWPPVDIPEEVMWEWMREQLITNSRLAAEKTGITQLQYLENIRPACVPITLDEIKAAYFDRKKSLSKQGASDSRRYWDEFAASVGVETAREIQLEHIEKFHDSVWDRGKKTNWSPTSIRHRLDCPRAFFRAALKKRKDIEQLKRVIDLMSIFERPAAHPADPRPLSREDFHALLDAASTKMQAVMLLGLNLACYPSEVSAIDKGELDLDKKTFVSRRNKTGITRIGVLWDRTLEAVREYLLEEPHGSDALFVNATGVRYRAANITRQFRKIREDAKLGDDVTFDRIRDSSYTRAVEAGAPLDQAKMLAGHKMPGISDAYLKRSPTMVSDACAAIEQFYFGLKVADGGDEAVA